MSNKQITITLYYTNWCKYCVEFKPVWEQIKNTNFDTMSELQNIKIIFNSIDKTSDSSPIYINNKQVDGFPTIKIEYDDKEYNFREFDNYSREYSSFIQFIKDLTSNKVIYSMMGGRKKSNEEKYRTKYHKYKTMYAGLLNKYKIIKNNIIN